MASLENFQPRGFPSQFGLNLRSNSEYQLGIRRPVVGLRLAQSGPGVENFSSRMPATSRRGPARARTRGMSTLAFKVNRKSGNYVKFTLIPANHSEQSRFGLLDGTIVGFFLFCVAGLVYLLMRI